MSRVLTNGVVSAGGKVVRFFGREAAILKTKKRTKTTPTVTTFY